VDGLVADAAAALADAHFHALLFRFLFDFRLHGIFLLSLPIVLITPWAENPPWIFI
jgi:hypothetical protein